MSSWRSAEETGATLPACATLVTIENGDFVAVPTLRLLGILVLALLVMRFVRARNLLMIRSLELQDGKSFGSVHITAGQRIKRLLGWRNAWAKHFNSRNLFNLAPSRP